MSETPRLVIRPHPRISKDEARNARARAWRFVFDCWEQKKAAGEDGGEDTKKEKETSFTRGPPQS